ncbi:hypothetical protein OBBRIDRAFT_720246, partial [Obba rivulosa]
MVSHLTPCASSQFIDIVLEFVALERRPSLSNASPRLPPELLDQIVGHLHDDRRALSNCSIASRALLPRARHHLFSHIRLNDS